MTLWKLFWAVWTLLTDGMPGECETEWLCFAPRTTGAADLEGRGNQVQAFGYADGALEIPAMIKTVNLESVFEMGQSTDRHRLIAEWHETVGIGYPKDDLATCLASEKDLWPELYALKGQRVWLSLRGDRIIGVEPEKPGCTCFEAVGLGTL